ncbi:MAG: carbon starvation protein A [Planctomycetes bacterium]|nr:carbon starvation protein A [Planctomycetota bacterium]
MSILSVMAVGLALLLAGYIFYGRFLSRYFRLDPNACTPAVEVNDGVDYVPAKGGFLLGQHFSAIAAAGPIVGPILAGIWFGWLPAVIWIVIGSIFIGGVHDFGALVASIRHKALSIGEIVKQHISKTAFLLFLLFIWLTLIYVIIAFTDITAGTFKTILADEAFGPGVAASSVLYLLLGVAMGVCLYKFKMPLWLATTIFIPLVLFVVWLGPHLPSSILSTFAAPSVKTWDVILLGYCFIAAVVPMWLLLQPRGYLGGCFLYGTILACLIGVFFGGYQAQYPAVNLAGLQSALNGKPLMPLLFITIACGAISGFHAIVASGTTSKQIRCEPDVRTVGYGSMILEGVVALLALSTVMFLLPNDETLKKDPNLIYATGIARYMKLIGIDFQIALSFALLAFSTFVYDTLDVCTRLGRYVLQELLGWKWKGSSLVAAFITLLIPLGFLMATKEKAYLVAWPVFGTSNQLLASLTLLGISVWLWRTGRNPLVTLIPMVFIMVMTFWSLVLLLIPGLKAVFTGQPLNLHEIVIVITAGILFILALCVIAVTAVTVARGRSMS